MHNEGVAIDVGEGTESIRSRRANVSHFEGLLHYIQSELGFREVLGCQISKLSNIMNVLTRSAQKLKAAIHLKVVGVRD